jgi:hypothetical protein
VDWERFRNAVLDPHSSLRRTAHIHIYTQAVCSESTEAGAVENKLFYLQELGFSPHMDPHTSSYRLLEVYDKQVRSVTHFYNLYTTVLGKKSYGVMSWVVEWTLSYKLCWLDAVVIRYSRIGHTSVTASSELLHGVMLTFLNISYDWCMGLLAVCNSFLHWAWWRKNLSCGNVSGSYPCMDVSSSVDKGPIKDYQNQE